MQARARAPALGRKFTSSSEPSRTKSLNSPPGESIRRGHMRERARLVRATSRTNHDAHTFGFRNPLTSSGAHYMQMHVRVARAREFAFLFSRVVRTDLRPLRGFLRGVCQASSSSSSSSNANNATALADSSEILARERRPSTPGQLRTNTTRRPGQRR